MDKVEHSDSSSVPPSVSPFQRGWLKLKDCWTVPAVRRGFLGSTLIACGGFTPAFLPEVNPLRHGVLAPIMGAWAGRTLLTAILIIGVVLIVHSWFKLRPLSGESGTPDFCATTALWSLPLLPVPPLFSNDAYSYAAQGNMVHLGSDPYAIGPSGAPGPFADQVDFHWRDTPAPYGPLSLQIQHGIVDLMGHQPFPAAVAMRLPALIALVIIAISLPIIARASGGSKDMALWFGLANPLVLMHVVAGAHNDALMIAGMAAAAALAFERRIVTALVVVGAAAAIKQPAIIMLAPVAAIWVAQQRPDFGREWISWKDELRFQPRLMLFGAVSAVVAVGSFCVITVATGLGFGWVAALSIPGSVRTPLTPSVIVGAALEIGSRAIGLRQVSFAVMDITRTVFSSVGILSLVWLWLRFGRLKPIWFVGCGLIALSVSGPAFHSWYILWGSTLLAGCFVGRTFLRWIIWTCAIFVAYSVIDVAFRNGLLPLGITGVAALAWVAVANDRRLRRATNQPAPS